MKADNFLESEGQNVEPDYVAKRILEHNEEESAHSGLFEVLGRELEKHRLEEGVHVTEEERKKWSDGIEKLNTEVQKAIAANISAERFKNDASDFAQASMAASRAAAMDKNQSGANAVLAEKYAADSQASAGIAQNAVTDAEAVLKEVKQERQTVFDVGGALEEELAQKADKTSVMPVTQVYEGDLENGLDDLKTGGIYYVKEEKQGAVAMSGKIPEYLLIVCETSGYGGSTFQLRVGDFGEGTKYSFAYRMYKPSTPTNAGGWTEWETYLTEEDAAKAYASKVQVDAAVAELLELQNMLMADRVKDTGETVIDFERFADSLLIPQTDGTFWQGRIYTSSRSHGGKYLAIDTTDNLAQNEYEHLYVPVYVEVDGYYDFTYIESDGASDVDLHLDTVGNKVTLPSGTLDTATMEKNGKTIYSYFESSWAKAETRKANVHLSSGLHTLIFRIRRRNFGDFAVFMDCLKISFDRGYNG